MATGMEDQVARLEAVATRLEAVARKLGKGGKAAASDDDEVEVSEAVLDFQAMLNTEVKACCDAWDALPYPKGFDNPSAMVKKCFENIVAFVSCTDTCKKPSPEELQQFCAAAIETISESEALVGTRKRKLFDFDNHHKVLNCMCDSIIWVSWYAPALPHQQATSGLESAMFHLNRILRKQKTPENVAWVDATKALLQKQVALIKEHFKTGLEWHGKKSVMEHKGTAPAVDAAPAAEPAAQETAAPEPEPEKAAPKEEAKPKKTGDLFGELNQGGNITSHLKKVKKTQKNKYKKKGEIKSTVKGGPSKAKVKKKLPDPKKQKRGKTWFLEYYQEGLITINEDLLNGLDLTIGLFIANCYNCNFMIPEGIKVKSICMDGCKRVQVQTADVVSTVEMVNCQNCTLWLNGIVPSVAVDKCDSPRVILMAPCWNQEKPVDILTSNVTAGNVEVPGADENSDNVAIPIPEQYYLRIDKESRTGRPEVMEHAG